MEYRALITNCMQLRLRKLNVQNSENVKHGTLYGETVDCASYKYLFNDNNNNKNNNNNNLWMSARQFLVDLGRKIIDRSGDDREGSFLFQRISVLLHRFNSILLHDSFVSFHCPDWWSFHFILYLTNFWHTFGIFQGFK